MTMSWFHCLTLLLLIHMVSATPFQSIPTTSGPATSRGQAPFDTLRNSTEFRDLQQLHNGNQKFRERLTHGKTIPQQDPGFMFIGCTDNRLSPSAIFNAPPGSIITHNNIGNQYSSKDPSVTAAVSYAVESSQVQHIIVLGHYGCKGAEAAITMSQKVNKLIRTWIKPIAELYSSSRRVEIVQLRDSRKPHREQPSGIKEAPASGNAGFRALVEENVKRSVRELRDNSLLAKAYSKPSTNNFDVFVHGFVLDETTGEVINLSVSFGPPGKPIQHPPFRALAGAQRFRHDRYY
jgi:carbonic anhydrase